MGSVPISGIFQAGNFIMNGYTPTILTPATSPLYHAEMKLMNQGVQHASPKHIIAQSIWVGLAVLGTDGSVCDDVATYSWVLSTTNDNIGPDVKGGSFLPPSAEYNAQYSKCPKAATLYAGLT